MWPQSIECVAFVKKFRLERGGYPAPLDIWEAATKAADARQTQTNSASAPCSKIDVCDLRWKGCCCRGVPECYEARRTLP